MPGIIGMLVNRIKSGLNLKVFKLIVGSIISSYMLLGMIPAYAAFAQNTLGGGAALTKPSASSTGSGSVVKQEKPEDPNNLFANNPKLKQALYDSIKEYDADVTLPGSVNDWHPKKADMEKINKLGLSGKDISDISFLKYFPNLEELRLDNNKISDLKPLESLTKLKKLSIQNNGLTDISSIGKVSTLKDLYLNGNQISDASPISNLSNLEYLFIANNNISEIGSLAKIAKHNLRHIEAQSNHISDFYKINNIIDCTGGQMFGSEPGACTPFHNYMYDFSDQDIIVNLKSEDAQSGNYSIPEILGNIKNIYGYCKADRHFVNQCTGFEKSFKFTKFTSTELVKFTAVDSYHKHDDYYPLRYGQLFKNLSFLGFYLNFSGRIELHQYFPQDANITLKFGDKLTPEILRKSIKVKNYPQDLFDKKYIDFSGPDEQKFKNFTSSVGVSYFNKPVEYDENGYVISNSVSEDSVNVNVNVLNMAQTWPVTKDYVNISDIDSSNAAQSSNKPTVQSISENVKKQVEELFVNNKKFGYPVIPSNKNKELNLKCDSCNPDDGDCSNVCPENYDSYSGFGINAIPTYRNNNGDYVPVFKVGDSYTDCGQGGCGGPGSSAPQYYYKAPTVTVGDFKIPEATNTDQTVNVPVTVSYVDGSQCTFDASFVVKAKPKPNPDPNPNPNPGPQPGPNPDPQPQPQPQPQPEPEPHPQPQPQPAPQPTPTPVPTPDPQNPPVVPTPAPTPSNPSTPNQNPQPSPDHWSHIVAPEQTDKPELNIKDGDGTENPDDIIHLLNPNHWNNNDSGTTGTNSTDSNAADFNVANPANTSNKGINANTGKTANKSSNKRHKLSNTGADTYCVIIASFSLLLVGLLVAISAKRKNVEISRI